MYLPVIMIFEIINIAAHVMIVQWQIINFYIVLTLYDWKLLPTESLTEKW